MFRKADIYVVILIVIISVFLVLDLFLIRGLPATMDGLTHVTTIAQFYQAIRQGDLHVTWADGFANYGLPMPIFIQQTTSYLGAWINFLVHDVILSYKFLYFIGTFVSALFMYIFLRIYFTPLYAFLGVFMFNFSPYRILNLYIRGALPEYFSSIFLPLILLSLYFFIKKKKFFYFVLFILSISGLILTHPMMMIVYAFICVPYFIFLLWGNAHKVQLTLIVAFGVLFGLLLVSFYLMPLLYEIKYFYYGLSKNKLALNQTLGIENFISEKWFYFYKNDILTRGHFIIVGIIEIISYLIGICFIAYTCIFNKCSKKQGLLYVSVCIATLLLFMATKYTEILYKKINILSSIQYPWRMLSGFIFIPPIICTWFASRLHKQWLVIVLIVVIAVIRFPELYGKNYSMYSQNQFYFIRENPQIVDMNTIWMGDPITYPVKKQKGEIIEGEGTIVNKIIKNSWRQYIIGAKTDIRMVDYTFYFPGWKVFVDGKDTSIEFQDINYRGVITYRVPTGRHTVLVKYTDTKVRKLANGISLAGFFLLLFLFFFRSKVDRFLNKHIYNLSFRQKKK
jgi:hypothetical protein